MPAQQQLSGVRPGRAQRHRDTDRRLSRTSTASAADSADRLVPPSPIRSAAGASLMGDLCVNLASMDTASFPAACRRQRPISPSLMPKVPDQFPSPARAATVGWGGSTAPDPELNSRTKVPGDRDIQPCCAGPLAAED